MAASPLRTRARVDGRPQPPRAPQTEHALHAVECTRRARAQAPRESVWSTNGMADGLPSHYSVRSDRSAGAIDRRSRRRPYGAVTTDDDDDDEQPEGCLGGCESGVATASFRSPARVVTFVRRASRDSKNTRPTVDRSAPTPGQICAHIFAQEPGPHVHLFPGSRVVRARDRHFCHDDADGPLVRFRRGRASRKRHAQRRRGRRRDRGRFARSPRAPHARLPVGRRARRHRQRAEAAAASFFVGRPLQVGRR